MAGLGLLLALLVGCASWPGAPEATAPAAVNVAAASNPGGPSGQVGSPVVKVEIEAPAALKDLLDRHLDLSRLARLNRGDAVTDTELARLIDAAPRQVRGLLQTEGYFKPELAVRRLPGASAGGAEQ